MMDGWRLKAIVDNYHELTTTMVLSEELLNRMRTVGLVDAAKREEIKNVGNDMPTRVRLYLEYLEKRPNEEFDLLCKCLTESNQAHVVEKYLKEPAGENGNGETETFLPNSEGSLSGPPTGEQISRNARSSTQDHRHLSPARMCTRKSRLITFGLTAIIVAVIIVVSVMTSKSQTRSDSLFYSAVPAINITNACLNAVRNGTQTVSQDDRRCGKKDPGFYPHDESCASFYLCCAGEKLAGEGTCSENYFFHPESQLCVDARGRYYRDPSHCGKYYECYNTPPRRTEQRSCSKGTYFRLDQHPPNCDHIYNVKDCHKKPLIPTL